MADGDGRGRIPGREIKLEVYYERDGRWLVDCNMDVENEAIGRARKLLGDERNSAVKVVRMRTVVATGFTSETTIFEQANATPVRKEIGLSATLESATICTTVEQLYGLDARMAINRILREFLDLHTISATELLYRQSNIKRLNGTGNLINQAISHVARAQTGDGAGSVHERITRLDALVAEATKKANAAPAELKGKAVLKAGGFADFLKAMKKDFGEPRWRFMAGVGLSDYAAGTPSWGGKFEKIAALYAPEVDIEGRFMLDELLGDVLFSRAVMEEIIGPQRRLADALCLLADLALARPVQENPRSSDLLRLLNRLIKDYGMPVCRAIIMDRIRRELKSNRPLNKNDPAGEAEALRLVRARLTDGKGQIAGGAAVQKFLDLRVQSIGQSGR